MSRSRLGTGGRRTARRTPNRRPPFDEAVRMCWASTLRPSSPMGARHWTGLPRSGRARVPEACQYVAQGRRRPFVSRNRSKQSAAIASRGGTVSSVARAQSRVALPPALMASGRPSDAGQPAQRVGVTTPRLTWPLDRLIPSSEAVEQRCRQGRLSRRGRGTPDGHLEPSRAYDRRCCVDGYLRRARGS